ncbi:YoaK family protein [Sandarakinorhabdus oryzae]|uniref:YoaK family protein n=1 Tax=Sandarakinorhabdus oryzae TaxID=2675220 RepID=UPI0012E19C64|nr:YoaK family protein [Sandarakinorhabdus oryzae]
MAGPASATSPLPGLLLLLSATTGLIDAVSVLGLGKVFTANMTGNIVFLGFAAARTPGFAAAPYLAALASFMLGATIAGRTGRRFAQRPLRHWLMLAALFETALFWAAAASATGFDVKSLSPAPALYFIIALTAMAMGFRNATVRQLQVPDLSTTVLTLTITGLAADSGLAGGASPNLTRRAGAVLAIFAGAALGALLVRAGGLTLSLALTGLIVLTGTCAAALHPALAPVRPK